MRSCYYLEVPVSAILPVPGIDWVPAMVTAQPGVVVLAAQVGQVQDEVLGEECCLVVSLLEGEG